MLNKTRQKAQAISKLALKLNHVFTASADSPGVPQNQYLTLIQEIPSTNPAKPPISADQHTKPHGSSALLREGTQRSRI